MSTPALPFTPADAETLLKKWAGENGYHIGTVSGLTRWEYTGDLFYAADAQLMQEDFSGGAYRFHIHADGTVTKFFQEEEV